MLTKSLGQQALFALCTSLSILSIGAVHSAIAQTPTSTNSAVNSPVSSALQDIANDNAEFATAFDSWMLRAYEGDRDAQFKVALMFSDGAGTEKDPEQAVYWYSQAARQGLASAQYNLGHKYLAGEGTPKDLSQAIKWWHKAALQEHELAQFNVARAYYGGIGVEKDIAQAKYWFSKAAANNEPRSLKIMQALYDDGEVQNITANGPTQLPDPSNKSSNDSSTTPTTDTTPVAADTNSVAVKNTTGPSATPIYNRPDKKSILVSMLPTNSQLTVIKQNDEWLNIQNEKGFPVWVYKDFVTVNGDEAVIKGNNVNARAVPLVLRGSVIGQLFDGTRLEILEQQEKWVRLQSPNNFTAWIEKSTLPSAEAVANTDNSNSNDTADNQQTASSNIDAINQVDASSIPAVTRPYDKPTNSAKPSDETYVFSNVRNDDDWLFAQEEKSYTLQLASFADDASLYKFLQRFKLVDDANARQFISNRNGIEWKYILYGLYASKAEASQAKQKKSFKRAWVRNVGQIRKNRCIAWKTTIPTPKRLKTYCQE